MEAKISPTITLYRGWNEPGRYVWSPFATKVEFRLRTSNTAYLCAAGSPRSGPKGKIPYLELATPSEPTECLADSTLILRSLAERGAIEDINAHLNAAQKGQDLAIRALLEDKLYFYHGHERWIKNYYTMRDHALWSIPYPIRLLVGILAYRANVRRLYEQGSGRFSYPEIRAFIREIWIGVNGLLEESRRKASGDECFWVLGGAEPSEADATVYGFVVSVLVCDAGPESRDLLKNEFPVILDFAKRIHWRWFPDYEIWPGAPSMRG
ncbi:hypothetical protein N0V90_009954 [Kalmusia sp. IMI 367209]|nr:hypothetical protein N0V90_009954 [Kalmusia sp. IMI 367209]